MKLHMQFAQLEIHTIDKNKIENTDGFDYMNEI